MQLRKVKRQLRVRPCGGRGGALATDGIDRDAVVPRVRSRRHARADGVAEARVLLREMFADRRPRLVMKAHDECLPAKGVEIKRDQKQSDPIEPRQGRFASAPVT